MVRECERQLEELAEYGVADDRAATSVPEWPVASWWAGFRVPQMAYLARLGQEQPGLLAEGDDLTVALHADFAARLSAVHAPAGK